MAICNYHAPASIYMMPNALINEVISSTSTKLIPTLAGIKIYTLGWVSLVSTNFSDCLLACIWRNANLAFL